MTISRKQLVVLIFGGLALLAVLSLMVITQNTIPVQAAGQEQEAPGADTTSPDSLSGGNDCYCTYPNTPPTPAPEP